MRYCRAAKAQEISPPVRHLKPGTRVRISNPLEGRFNKGRIKSRDGEYYLILVDYEGGKYAADYPDGVLVERYLCEITPL